MTKDENKRLSPRLEKVAFLSETALEITLPSMGLNTARLYATAPGERRLATNADSLTECGSIMLKA